MYRIRKQIKLSTKKKLRAKLKKSVYYYSEIQVLQLRVVSDINIDFGNWTRFNVRPSFVVFLGQN